MIYEKQTFERDTICPRCSSFLIITEKIVFKEDDK